MSDNTNNMPPTAPAAAPATVPAPVDQRPEEQRQPVQQPVTGHEQEQEPSREDLRLQNEALRRDIEHFKAKAAEADRRAALAEAAKKSQQASSSSSAYESRQVIVQTGLKRDQCIKAVGGLAHWTKLSMDDRQKLQGLPPASPERIEKAREIFRKGNSGLAREVHTASPAEYAALKALADDLP